jgi:hypothetical protein
MPLKASIGLSKKVGLPDYGSLGASCNLEVELDASVVQDPEAFHERIRRLYTLANQAVVDQLAHANGNGKSNGQQATGNGQSASGNGSDSGGMASNKQVKYLLDIARQRHQMDLARLSQFCSEQVGVSDVYQLTKNQASAVIDRLSPVRMITSSPERIPVILCSRTIARTVSGR